MILLWELGGWLLYIIGSSLLKPAKTKDKFARFSGFQALLLFKPTSWFLSTTLAVLIVSYPKKNSTSGQKLVSKDPWEKIIV